MTDLDTALRDMLTARAGDITTAPDSIAHFAPAGPIRRRRPSRTTWLIAATIAAVLAAAGTAVALRSGTHRKPIPVTSHQRTVTALPTPPASPHAERKVALTWFGMAGLPGFAQHLRASEVGYRMLAVRATSDRGVPIGCNGCENASDYIYVIDKGVFDAAQVGVLNWSTLSVDGKTAYLGTMAEYPHGRYRVPTLALQYRPGAWVLVQGVTAFGRRTATLTTVAKAVRPTVAVPIVLPFKLTYVPRLPITEIVDDRSEGYAFTLSFGSVEGRSFGITLWPPDDPKSVPVNAKTRRGVDGLTGYYSDDVLYADIHDAMFEMGIAESDSVDQTAAAADKRDMAYAVAGLRWTNGDGRAPFIPATQAIP